MSKKTLLGLRTVKLKPRFGSVPTVLPVEQNVRQALRIADRGYVLEGGQVILQGQAGELLEHSRLVRSNLGIHKAEARP